MFFWTATVALFIGVLQLIAFAQSKQAAEVFMFASTPFGLWGAVYHALWKTRMRICLLIAQMASLVATAILAIAYSGRGSLGKLVDPGDYFLCAELWLILATANAFVILVVFGVAFLLKKAYQSDL